MNGNKRRRQASSAGVSDHALEHLRIPPMSIEAEQAVLGGLMLVAESFDLVVDVLTEQDFYRRDHQIIYRAIRELAEKSQPFDAVTLADWCRSNGLEEQTGGLSYFIDLTKGTPSAANIGAYAHVVRERSMLRQLIEVSTGIANDGFQPEGRSAREILDTAEARVLAIAEQGARGRKYTLLRAALAEAFDVIQQRAESEGGITGLATGYTEFDKMTTGLQPTDLIIVAGRPAMGKTTFALNIAEHAAVKSKKVVAVFSMEMPTSQLAMRLISAVGRINAGRLRTGNLEDEEWPRVNSALQTLHGAKIVIDDEGRLSPERLRAKARRIKREQGDLGLIVIDYLQLMEVPGNVENRATEIAAISRSLKALAKELNVPVVALSQLNRSLETRTDKRPVMADLRESGAIEQDADMIVFIYRDEYYNRENSPDKGLAEIIIGKHRNGETGSFKLRFFGEHTRFDNQFGDAVGALE